MHNDTLDVQTGFTPEQSTTTPFWARPENFVQPGDEDFGANYGDDDNETGDETGQETPVAQSPNPETKPTDQKADQFDLSEVKDDAVKSLMLEEASKRKLDLSNPRDRALAQAIAEGQNQVRILSKRAEPSEQGKSYLNSVLSKFDEKPPEPQAEAFAQTSSTQNPAAAPAPSTAPAFVGLSEKWNTPEDFTGELLDAYESQDRTRIAQTYMGLHHRMMADYMPVFEQRVQQVVAERLGPLVQEAEAMQGYQLNNQVIEILKGEPDFSEIEAIFDKASGGTVELNGQNVSDTWINRILAKNPMIELIEVKGKTKAETDRKTRAARYAAVYEEFQRTRNGSIDPKKAKDLVEAGRTVERNRRDPVRQGLSSGRTGVPSGKTEQSITRSIVNHTDGTMSVDDFFK